MFVIKVLLVTFALIGAPVLMIGGLEFFLSWLLLFMTFGLGFCLLLFFGAWVPHYREYGDMYEGNAFTGPFRGYRASDEQER